MLDLKRPLRCGITPLEAYSQSSDREKSVNKRQQHKGIRAVLGNGGGRSAEREGGGERDSEGGG